MKICLVTLARSDYDRLKRLAALLDRDPDVDLIVLPIGMHLSPAYGMTVDAIEEDGFAVDDHVEMMLSSESAVGASKTVGVGVIGLADVLHRIGPDFTMVLGDRSELLAVASVCVCQGIPLAHLCGGEITEGAIDDQVRHMLTKASHLHFAANEVYAQRILQMGEEDWRVCTSGSPALDNIRTLELMGREQLELDLDFDLSRPTALVTFHPTTLDDSDVGVQVEALVRALEASPLQHVITYPNADAGSGTIIRSLQEFARTNGDRVRLVKNLGGRRYLSLLGCVAMMIGNSSSGIVEAPSFNLPVVNIGDRQAGRVFGENVIQADCTRDAILAGIDDALAYDLPECENPYGDMEASEKIVEYTKRVFCEHDKNRLMRKKFTDRI